MAIITTWSLLWFVVVLHTTRQFIVWLSDFKKSFSFQLSRHQRRIKNEFGQGLAEYIVIAVLVAIIVIVALRFFGGSITGQFENATQQVRSIKDGGNEEVSVGAARAERGGSDGASTESGKQHDDGGGEGNTTEEGVSPKVESGSSDNDIERLRKRGIGEEELDPATEIELDWKTLAFVALIMIGIGAYVVFQGGEKKNKKAPKQKKKKAFSRNDSGQAIVEFVLIAITFLFVILGVIQLALVLNAYSLVRYAAYNAARAAIVHSADSDKMLEAARLSLVATFPSHGRADHLRGFMENYVAARATDSLPIFTDSFDSITEVKVLNNNGVGSGEVVTFDDPRAGTKPVITVQVVHRYQLIIPLVNRITYYVYNQVIGGGGYAGESLNRMSAETDRMRRAGGDYYDIEYRIPIVAHYTMRMQSDYQGS